ncbi:aldo/keto reductase [Dactylosporangium sp. CA-092794]|uniref:aldo/keto reductase n=1 Tax=Dactylosporangium sp. CA-092794 TaxID=3239929 RepID=UPI003D94847F
MTEHRGIDIGGGKPLPMVGLGTWNVTGEDVGRSVRAALAAGYRHIDTAYGYQNEAEIGKALADCGVDREEIFLTSKIPPRRVGFERETLERSLRQLRTDYLDLWLIHAPPAPEQSVPLWKFLTAAREEGKVRAVGVSNYSTAQIDELVDATGIVPAVNQIKWTPELFDRRRMEESHERGIVLEGFSAIRLTDLNDPTLVKVANAHSVTPAQVILRWHIQHDVVCLPRSVREERIRENIDIWDFELSADELLLVDVMSTVV